MYHLSGLKNGQRTKIRYGVNVLITLIGMLSIIFLVLGFILPSLRLELLGLLGLASEAGNQFTEAVSFHSIYSIVQLILNEAIFIDTFAQYVGLGTLVALLILTSLIVPITLVLSLLIIWFVPMKRRRRNHLLVFIDILKAWQYIEVYIISIIVAAWQLGGVSEFLFNEDFCKGSDELFSQLAYYGVISEEESKYKCFYNQGDVWIGVIFLILSSLMIFWLSNFVLMATNQKHIDDDENNKTYKTSISQAEDEISIIADRIKPPAVKFTDAFPLFLSSSFSSSILKFMTSTTNKTFNQSEETFNKDLYEKTFEASLQKEDISNAEVLKNQINVLTAQLNEEKMKNNDPLYINKIPKTDPQTIMKEKINVVNQEESLMKEMRQTKIDEQIEFDANTVLPSYVDENSMLSTQLQESSNSEICEKESIQNNVVTEAFSLREATTNAEILKNQINMLSAQLNNEKMKNYGLLDKNIMLNTDLRTLTEGKNSIKSQKGNLSQQMKQIKIDKQGEFDASPALTSHSVIVPGTKIQDLDITTTNSGTKDSVDATSIRRNAERLLSLANEATYRGELRRSAQASTLPHGRLS